MPARHGARNGLFQTGGYGHVLFGAEPAEVGNDELDPARLASLAVHAGTAIEI
jgi:hypothetical protein